MYRTGHYGMALLVYAPVGFGWIVAGFQALAMVGGAIVVGGAMLPDLDQRVPGIRHRGPTHTVWFALLVGLLLGLAGGAVMVERSLVEAIAFAAFGLFIGILTIGAHLLADALTPAGIQPFAPVSSAEYTLNITKAANPISNYILLAIGIGAAGGALVVARQVGTGV